MTDRLKLLTIDDDEVDRLAVRRALERAGQAAEIREAVTLAAAFELLSTETFDCALLDYRLPDGTGLELLQRLAQESVDRPPIILLTGLDDEEVGVAALQQGAEDYLVKGKIDGVSLKRTIRYAIERFRTRRKLERETKILKKVSGALKSANDKLSVMAATDALTGAPNRRALELRLTQLLAEARRGRKFALVMADVDHFKQFNDTFGHAAGDGVLVSVTRCLATAIREMDFLARYGGEEFCVLFADVDEATAAGMAERLRRAVEEMPNAHRNVTMSFGVCAYHVRLGSGDPLLKAADAALYRAKKLGRNRVEVHGEATGAKVE